MSRRERARDFRRKIEANLNATRKLIRVDEISEEELNELVELYEPWKIGMTFTGNDVGTLINYEGQLYKILQPHTTQGDWLPSNTPSLYSEMYPEEVIGEWKQPQGEHDAYNKGDKVIFNDKVYESTIDANTWSPSEHPQGWEVVKGEEVPVEPEKPEEEETELEEEEPIEEEIIEEPIEEDPEPEENIEEWKQPTGGHDSYNTGDIVIFNNRVYESIMDGNTWSPTDYPQGWKEIK